MEKQLQTGRKKAWGRKSQETVKLWNPLEKNLPSEKIRARRRRGGSILSCTGGLKLRGRKRKSDCGRSLVGTGEGTMEEGKKKEKRENKFLPLCLLSNLFER